MHVIEFPFADPSSAIAIDLGPIVIRWYALAYIAGLLIGWRYVSALLSRQTVWPGGRPPIEPRDTEDLLFWMTIGVVVGGRVGFVMLYAAFKDPSILWSFVDLNVFGLFTMPFPQSLAIWEGGMAFHGGMVGVALVIIWFARARGTSVLSLADAVGAAAPIGLFFGRLANFVNGELWGRPTDAPWGMVFPQVDQLAQAYPWLLQNGVNGPRHPSQLYEAALEGALLFGVLAWLAWRTNALRSPGLITGVFLVGYGLTRGFVEFFRQWNVEGGPDGFDFYIFGEGITRGQTLCIPMILLGAWLIWRARRSASAPAAA